MLYPYHIAREHNEPMPVGVELPTVEADEPIAAVAKLANGGLLPSDGSFWVRLIVEADELGRTTKVAAVPLTVEAKIPLDWR